MVGVGGNKSSWSKLGKLVTKSVSISEAVLSNFGCCCWCCWAVYSTPFGALDVEPDLPRSIFSPVTTPLL